MSLAHYAQLAYRFKNQEEMETKVLTEKFDNEAERTKIITKMAKTIII